MLRRLLPTVMLIALLVPAGVAIGSRIEVGGAEHLLYSHGSDPYGKVTFGYSYIPTHLTHPPVINKIYLDHFRFASECSRAGIRVPGTIRITKKKRFHYHAHGVDITGSFKGRFVGTPYPSFRGTIVTLDDCGDRDVMPFTAAR